MGRRYRLFYRTRYTIYDIYITLNFCNNTFSVFILLHHCFGFPDIVPEGGSSDPYDPPLDLPLHWAVSGVVTAECMLHVTSCSGHHAVLMVMLTYLTRGSLHSLFHILNSLKS